jgi:hypothetical protein
MTNRIPVETRSLYQRISLLSDTTSHQFCNALCDAWAGKLEAEHKLNPNYRGEDSSTDWKAEAHAKLMEP